MNLGTFIVLLILVCVVYLIIRSMMKDKKAGKSPICGGDCSHCGGYCHQMNLKDSTKSSCHK
jgi:hypothetical protein